MQDSLGDHTLQDNGARCPALVSTSVVQFLIFLWKRMDTSHLFCSGVFYKLMSLIIYRMHHCTIITSLNVCAQLWVLTFFLLIFLSRRLFSLFFDYGEASEVGFGLVRLPCQVHLHVALLRFVLLYLFSVQGLASVNMEKVTEGKLV